MSKVPLNGIIKVRPINPLDAARCLFLNEPGQANLAHPLTLLPGNSRGRPSLAELLNPWLPHRRRGRAWVLQSGSRANAMVIARPRSGLQSWEISHLIVGPESEASLPELLENIAKAAAPSGCERVFLRLLRDDPMVDVARLAGFFPCIPEVLYEAPSQQAAGAGPTCSSDPHFPPRKRSRGDEHELFRLYNRSTPPEIRQALGMTFAEWTASRERCHGRRQELVWEQDGVLTGWLSAGRCYHGGHMAALIYADAGHGPNVDNLVNSSLQRLRGNRPVHWLISEHQHALQEVLEERGFDIAANYVTTLKSMVATAKERAPVRATVVSA